MQIVKMNIEHWQKSLDIWASMKMPPYLQKSVKQKQMRLYMKNC